MRPACIILFIALLATFVPGVARALEIPTPRATHSIAGGNGVTLAVQEWGVADGKPIVFIHAWSQSHLGWLPQITGDLAATFRVITLDLRGHGNSDKPLDKTQYNTGDVWADDLNAVISTLDLKETTLVGWSYGSIVIGDYLTKYGTDKVAAINIVGGLTGIGVDRVADHFGPAVGDVMKAMEPSLPDQAIGMIATANMMVPDELDRETYGFLIATNMVVPPLVRQAMTERSVDFELIYKQLSVPVLFTHGTDDQGVLPIAAKEGAALAPKGQLSLYQGANHGPHWADAARFNTELAKLIENASN
jgi:pimeloyl-ACP methyl ester carboxylesterase